jgi:hypothetical protein
VVGFRCRGTLVDVGGFLVRYRGTLVDVRALLNFYLKDPG